MKKERKSKIYGVMLEIREKMFLSIQYADSLEEAFSLARLEFEILNKEDSFGAKISLFTSKSPEQLIRENHTYGARKKKLRSTKKEKLEGKIPFPKKAIKIEEPEWKKKSNTMQKLIDTNNLKAIKSKSVQFTKEERAYMRDKIREKSENIIENEK